MVMFEQLGDAIDGLDIPADGAALAAALALRDGQIRIDRPRRHPLLTAWIDV